jgi:hypothetical protein
LGTGFPVRQHARAPGGTIGDDRPHRLEDRVPLTDAETARGAVDTYLDMAHAAAQMASALTPPAGGAAAHVLALEEHIAAVAERGPAALPATVLEYARSYWAGEVAGLAEALEDPQWSGCSAAGPGASTSPPRAIPRRGKIVGSRLRGQVCVRYLSDLCQVFGRERPFRASPCTPGHHPRSWRA